MTSSEPHHHAPQDAADVDVVWPLSFTQKRGPSDTEIGANSLLQVAIVPPLDVSISPLALLTANPKRALPPHTPIIHAHPQPVPWPSQAPSASLLPGRALPQRPGRKPSSNRSHASCAQGGASATIVSQDLLDVPYRWTRPSARGVASEGVQEPSGRLRDSTEMPITDTTVTTAVATDSFWANLPLSVPSHELDSNPNFCSLHPSPNFRGYCPKPTASPRSAIHPSGSFPLADIPSNPTHTPL
ncbi:hypothetical protein BKA56DRAFT_610134 [Ilyonectria sp. MPI-CAGE-AT-0026]|nr:hypothetical protein BKA56DRAFT_610134 [Ilyonectria sp. MPI-CAGE-AT-0026]